MTDQKRSNFHAVFTEILCGLNFGDLRSQNSYDWVSAFDLKPRRRETFELLKFLLFKPAKFVSVRPTLVRHLLHNRLLKLPFEYELDTKLNVKLKVTAEKDHSVLNYISELAFVSTFGLFVY